MIERLNLLTLVVARVGEMPEEQRVPEARVPPLVDEWADYADAVLSGQICPEITFEPSVEDCVAYVTRRARE